LKLLRFTFIILAVTTCCSNLLSQEEQRRFYFYRPENTSGSDGQFNPVSLFLNGSFDILRNGGHHKKIFAWDYDGDATQVWKNLRDPFGNVKKFGFKEFIHQEIFNFTIGEKSAEFLPNIADHIIGNGMQYAKLAEYFEYRNSPLPYLWSGITTTAYQVMNEVMESEGWRGVNVDLIADIYLFNTAGLALFSTEWGKRFFSETLPVNRISAERRPAIFCPKEFFCSRQVVAVFLLGSVCIAGSKLCR
jgi:hypothetical protein